MICSVDDVPRLLHSLSTKEVDITLGSRFLPGASSEGIPRVRKWLLRLAVIMTCITTGLKLSDTHNGLRAMNRFAASKICLTCNRMAHASEFLSQISKHRLRFQEIPVTISYSEYSLRKGQRLSNSFNVLWELVLGYFRL